MLSQSVTAERGAEGLANALCHWLANPRSQAHSRRCTIAISRQAGTPGSALAEELGRRLHWPVYDRMLIEKIAHDMGLHAKLLESVDERRKGWFRESIEALTTGRSVNECAFVRRLVETLLSLASHGHCVIVGRGSPHVLPSETTLRVRLVASRQERILAAQRIRHMTADEATSWVETTDRERHGFLLEHFGRDILDPGWYDVILNASRWSIPQCAEIVVQAIKQMESPK